MTDCKAIGIIAEYNPFHNGHAWQIAEAKHRLGDLPIVIALSGNFVQRGEPAIMDKWTRTRLALAGGADLVLELPAAFSVRSADYFARGGVSLLASTGVVSHLVFGVETATADIDVDALARYLLSDDAGARILTLMRNGASYGSAWERTAEEWHPGAGKFLRGANNVLAMSYRKALAESGARLAPLALPRQGADYNDKLLGPGFASATALREVLQSGGCINELSRYVPAATLSALKQTSSLFPAHPSALVTLLSYRLLQLTAKQLYNVTSADLGFCNRVLGARGKLAQGYDSFARTVVNKRYSATALRRLTLQLLLNENRSFWYGATAPAYLRVLGFNSRGRALLRVMKRTASLPVISKLGRLQPWRHSEFYNRLLSLDIRATDLYALLGGRADSYGEDFLRPPVIVN